MCCLGWSLWSKSDSHGPVVSWEREGYFTNPFSQLFLLLLILQKTHQLVHPLSLFPFLPSLCSPSPSFFPSLVSILSLLFSLASNSQSSSWSQARPACLASCFLRVCCVWLLTHFSGLLHSVVLKPFGRPHAFSASPACAQPHAVHCLFVQCHWLTWKSDVSNVCWEGSSCFTSGCQTQIPKVWVFFKI